MEQINPAESLCSVILPAYNSEKYIGSSIYSALNQSYKNIEIIIIDDCSTDGTYQIIKQFEKDARVKVYKNQKNVGTAETRNRGFAAAAGQYIAFLDSDDIWKPEKLERQLSCMRQSDWDICYSSYSYIDYAGKKIGPPRTVSPLCTFQELLKNNYICCSSVILKKELLDVHKMGNDFFHEDYVLWLQLLRDGYKAGGCTESLVDYRLSKLGRSHDKINAAEKRWDIYRNFLHMNFIQSLYYFTCYMVNGICKYLAIK